MKLRKSGEIVKLNLAEVVRKHNEAVIREAAKGVEASEETIAKAVEALEKQIKPYSGITLGVVHLGWAEAERWRLEAERLQLENEREIRDLRREYTATEWPELHDGGMDLPGAQKRLVDYRRALLTATLRMIDGVEGEPPEPEQIVDLILGLGAGDAVTHAVLRVQRPTAQQVF